MEHHPTRGLPKDSGWPALFWQAFTGSRNAMVLLDGRRAHVEVNGAYVELLGYPPKQLIGQPIYQFVAGGPIMSDAAWKAALSQKQLTGTAELMARDDSRVRVEYAGHPELVTGRQLVLFVALRTARGVRRYPPDPAPASPSLLTQRELEVVRLIAMGLTGPEIAQELHVAHDTVRTHARNAMSKVGARSRAHLVAVSLGSGLSNPGPVAIQPRPVAR